MLFINCRVAFGKVWYDIYDMSHEHIASLVLRKSHLRGKIQRRVPEFDIIDKNETASIGKISLFSTDLEQSEHGQAIVAKGTFRYVAKLLFKDNLHMFSST